jgi:hypothetical protein
VAAAEDIGLFQEEMRRTLEMLAQKNGDGLDHCHALYA